MDALETRNSERAISVNGHHTSVERLGGGTELGNLKRYGHNHSQVGIPRKIPERCQKFIGRRLMAVEPIPSEVWWERQQRWPACLLIPRFVGCISGDIYVLCAALHWPDLPRVKAMRMGVWSL